MKLREIAELLKGEVVGDPETEITGVAGAEDAGPGDITFAASKKHLALAGGGGAACVMVKEPVEGMGKAQLRVADPHYAFAVLLERFYPRPRKPGGVSPLAFVSESATLGAGVTVEAFAYVSDRASVGEGTAIGPGVFIGEAASLGRDCLIYPNVVVREKVAIGDRVIIHPGAVIGSDGFGYVQKEGRHHKIPQVGGVRVGNDVEIGANVTIDRATTGVTVIGDGTKIDNLVQIAHNVVVGRAAIIVAQAGVAGSTEIGDMVMIGGQVGVADHSKLAPGTMIGAQSGVMGEVARGVYSGSPAIPHRDWLRASSVFAKLPELQRRIKALEEKLEETERRLGGR
ncbi:MAG: UDP-3-O-(3-hydroxymyristoyl)glucosamine N-acyltransferase [Thermodesulfovibrionales bacterium]